jgi:hypothetical protein
MVAYYEPLNWSHNLKVLHRIPNPKPQAGTPAMKVIEAWEETVNMREKRFQTALDSDTRMGALCQLLPDVLREHTCTKAGRYTTYDAMRQAAVFYLEEKQDASDDVVPMHVEQQLLALGPKGKGDQSKSKGMSDKGKSKGKGKEEGGKARTEATRSPRGSATAVGSGGTGVETSAPTPRERIM